MPASFSTKREDRAALDGFELEIFKLVREHATSQQWREWLRAPLEHVAADGNLDLFTRLMDAGADGSAGWRGCNGRTLLGAAAHGESNEIVQALLNAGAKDDLNVMFEGNSALHVAAAHGAEKMCNVLVLAGADMGFIGWSKETPLHLAARRGHVGVVNTLVQHGADPNAGVEFRGDTPLTLATEEGHAQCVSRLLAGGGNIDSCDAAGYAPLHLATIQNRLGLVEQLLAAGANVDIRFDRSSPLEIAAGMGYVDAVSVLLRHGSSVNAPGHSGETALHSAARGAAPNYDNVGVIRVLLEAGADTEVIGEDERTPLQLAAFRRSSITIRALLEGGANVNAHHCCSEPALHHACLMSWADHAELLLRFGADEKLTINGGQTAGDMLGRWETGNVEDSVREQRKADDQRICRMLARAPADRAWRRRGWLVLNRSCPAKRQLAFEHNNGGGANGSNSDAGGNGDTTADQARAGDLERAVHWVVGLNVEGVFRVVVGFL